MGPPFFLAVRSYERLSAAIGAGSPAAAATDASKKMRYEVKLRSSVRAVIRPQSMWMSRSEAVTSGIRLQILQNQKVLSFRDLFQLLEESEEFAWWYSDTLAGAGLEAFFWEHPPLTSQIFDYDAEFVLIESPSLSRTHAEPASFESQFASQPIGDVITFPNLGGDAILVVPRPVGPVAAYPHLAVFLRNAPRTQVQSLWNVAAQVVRENLSSVPKWLSTAGLGVPWLHLRLDSRPKYYRFGPYKAAA